MRTPCFLWDSDSRVENLGFQTPVLWDGKRTVNISDCVHLFIVVDDDDDDDVQ